MKAAILTGLISRLIDAGTTNRPLISCFVNLEHPRSDCFKALKSHASAIERRLNGQRSLDFKAASEEVDDYLAYPFEVLLANEFNIDELPNIYPVAARERRMMQAA